MATRDDEIDSLNAGEIQTVWRQLCSELDCGEFFDRADCRYVCPEFKGVVDRHLEAQP